MSGFHGNKVLHRLVDNLIEKSGISSFVETGTHYAATTIHVASRHPQLPVFTCEINREYHDASAKRLEPHKNVRLSLESSEKFIARLLAGNDLGSKPLFFLDAHWHDHWPLPDEVAAIAKLPAFALLVDDFAVPGQGHFETSAGGGGTIGEHRTKPDKRPCDMSLISPLLPKGCDMAYPAYGKLEAFGSPNVPHLVGYVLVAKGMDLTGAKAIGLHTWGIL